MDKANIIIKPSAMQSTFNELINNTALKVLPKKKIGFEIGFNITGSKKHLIYFARRR